MICPTSGKVHARSFAADGEETQVSLLRGTSTNLRSYEDGYVS